MLSLVPFAALAFIVPAQQDTGLIENAIARDAKLSRDARLKPEAMGGWNAGFHVLFKGKVSGTLVTPDEDGKPFMSMLVKTSNGGTSHVRLAPKEYVEANVRLHLGDTVWVAGTKAWDGYEWVVHAQRLNVNCLRPAFRTRDGTPLWR